MFKSPYCFGCFLFCLFVCLFWGLLFVCFRFVVVVVVVVGGEWEGGREKVVGPSLNPQLGGSRD